MDFLNIIWLLAIISVFLEVLVLCIFALKKKFILASDSESAVLIAERLEKEGFVRQKETKPQSEMENFESRLENIRDCFKVTAPEKFSGKNIILIDDVSTSGATFLTYHRQASSVGMRPAEVYGWCR